MKRGNTAAVMPVCNILITVKLNRSGLKLSMIWRNADDKHVHWMSFVNRYPDKLALVFKDKRLTYR